MSFQVLVIPEDPLQNGYILKPLIAKLLQLAGKPKAIINVQPKPRVRGYESAVHAIRNTFIFEYGHYDLWIFVPDSDKAKGLDALEAEMQTKGVRLICCAAKPELEIWPLAGFSKELAVTWREAREHPRLKEEVFTPALEEFGNKGAAGQGREEMMKETLKNTARLLQLCDELSVLCSRLKEVC